VTAQGVVAGTAATGRQPIGALTGKVVFTVGGHGFTAFRTVDATTGAVTEGWHTQRPEVAGTEMVEDLGNQDQMSFYVNHLFNAGATVVPLRPVGYQPNEVLLDNDSPSVTYTGSWSNSTSTIFYGSAGDVPYRFAAVSATQTATAKFTPNIAVAGFYPVYTWVKDDVDRVNQLYRVAHSGGISEVRVDHSRIGKGYVYLGTYHFNTGTAGYVEISNQGTNTGSSVVIADHIRFGNGMGDIDRGWGVSQQTRSDESSLFWIEHQRGQGVPTSDYRSVDAAGVPTSTDDDANVSAPPRWAAHMNREIAGTNNEIFLSFHSNAGGGRGTLGLFNGNNDPATKTPFQFEWASLVGKEVNDDMVALGAAGRIESTWSNKTNPTLDRSDIEFGEINNLRINNEFDATILEVAYHDNTTDAALMRDPKVRDWVARASVQATIKYFNQYGSNPNVTLPPESPANVRAVTQNNGDVVVSWAAPVANPGSGDAATGYVVYSSTSGYGFNNAITVAGVGTLSLTIPAAQLAAGANYFRVSATNAGGESMPTETVAARAVASGGKILIVNGFDRIDRFLNPTQTTPLSYDPPFSAGTGNTFERVRARFSNAYDYVVQAAEAIEAFNAALRVDTASNEAVIAGQVNLANYAGVIWLSGEEGVADKTFDATEQSLITSYLNAGGKLFVSGSEIGFELDGSAVAPAFYNGQLRADYVADSAGVYGATGVAGSIFAGISLAFDNGSSGTYNVNAADRITPLNGSTAAMNYSGGSNGAAIQYANPNGGRVVYMAFPFETITTAANRNAVMAAVLNYFNLGLSVGSMSGRVIRDVNGDGIANAGEIGLSGWTIFLDADNDGIFDAGETSTTTNASGDWSFIDLPVGTYNVRVDQQSGWLRTAPSGSGAHVVTVTTGSNSTGLNFTEFRIGYTGGSGADEWTLKMDPANNGRVQIIEILSGQAPFTSSIAKSLLSTLSFDGAAGDDKLTVDHTLASPIPSGGVTYAGGANGIFTGDQVIITGTASADAVTASGGAITFGGTINHSGLERIVANLLGGDDSFNFNAPTAATVLFNGGTSTTADTITVAGGTWTLAADAIGGTANLNINVNAGATARFNATQHLNRLALAGGVAIVASGGGNTIVTKSLDITGSGRIDLADNDLVIDYAAGTSSPMNTILPWLLAGRNDGDWLGNGIASSSAGDTGLIGLGIGEAADLLGIAGTETGLFGTEPVDASAVVIKYTYLGDANLDGIISGDDYSSIDFNIGVAGASGYSNGDFNYDGIISGDDYSTIDFNFAAQGGPL
jgi:hypothetical protein